MEHLLQALPDVAFHVLAHSHFGFNLVKLEQYPNLILYPSFDPLTSRKVLEKIDFIWISTHLTRVDHITENDSSVGSSNFLLKRPIMTTLEKNQVFKNDQVDQMVEAVRDYIDTIER